MDTLVQRLRQNFKNKFPAWTIQGEAADEIERLRASENELSRKCNEFESQVHQAYNLGRREGRENGRSEAKSENW